MNLKRLPRYLKAVCAAFLTTPPRAYLKLLSHSPYVVKELDRYGFSMLVDSRDPAISKPILALGEYEEPFTRQLLARIGPTTHFLDVGANIGFFTLAAASRAARGRIWSIEPDPVNVRLLKANVALNGFDSRVTVFHMAAGDADGELFFSSLGHDRNIGARFTAKAEATLLDRSAPHAAKPVRVPARTVDGLLGNESIELIKVDVEGFEPAVFGGMQQTLRRQRPVVFSEFAPGTIRHISKTDPADLLRQILDLGYTVSRVLENGTLPPPGRDVEAIMAHHDDRRHHLDLIFEPVEKSRP